jgi:glucose-1-phosphate thymidylyltransferase
MIYYPLSNLINANIREICIISSPEYIHLYETLFGNGSQLGLEMTYKIQYKARGISESFLIAEDFIGDDNVSLILGDNLFHGVPNVDFNGDGAVIFAYKVNDPERYGVVDFDENNKAISIEEKPLKPKSDYAVTGLYFYDNTCVEKAKTLIPSARGELEITDLNNLYLMENKLNVVKFPRGTAWLDAGTPETLFQSAMYVQSVQERTGSKIGCIEEECFRQGYIDASQLIKIIDKTPKSEYKTYLTKILS